MRPNRLKESKKSMACTLTAEQLNSLLLSGCSSAASFASARMPPTQPAECTLVSAPGDLRQRRAAPLPFFCQDVSIFLWSSCCCQSCQCRNPVKKRCLVLLFLDALRVYIMHEDGQPCDSIVVGRRKLRDMRSNGWKEGRDLWEAWNSGAVHARSLRHFTHKLQLAMRTSTPVKLASD